MNATSKVFLSAIVAIVVIHLSGIGPVAAAAPSRPSQTDIQTLLQLSGGANIGERAGEAVAQQIIMSLHRGTPSPAAEVDAEIRQFTLDYVRDQASHDNLSEQVANIYAQHLSSEDVQQLIQFYRSPVGGRKLVNEMPSIASGSGELGSRWTASILPGLKAKLHEK